MLSLYELHTDTGTHIHSRKRMIDSICPPLKKSKMKFDQIAVIGFHDEENETDEDKDYVDYGVERMYIKCKTKKYHTQKAIYSIFNDDFPDLSHLTSSSKLVLIGHLVIQEDGSKTFAGLTPEAIYEALFEDCELKQVGSIKFVSCELMDGPFIQDFLTLLKNSPTPNTQVVAYTQKLMIGFDGKLNVDLGEEIGINSAKAYKVKS